MVDLVGEVAAADVALVGEEQVAAQRVLVRINRPYACSALARLLCRLLACSLAMSRLAMVCPNFIEATRPSRSFQCSAISWV